MNQTVHPLRINVGFLVNQPPGFQREVPIEFDHFRFDEDFLAEDLRGTITLSHTQNGVRSMGEISARIPLECGRCLDDYQQELQSEFEEIFTFSHRPLSEDEAIISEDGNIDFEPIIREYLLLEIPFSPVCRSDCRGLCSVCGQNLNEMDCGHMQASLTEEESSITIKRSNQSS
ncbi:MAG: DUF177 domain-containing protein [Chloroflexi bacterium]|nr:DUF177 domain-containing protein [Chloroflexota bacterium]